MSRFEYIDLAVNVIFTLAALYAVYRIVKWTLDFKITIKINDLVMEQENGGYRKGYGGPLIDRGIYGSEVMEERGIKLVDRHTGKAVDTDQYDSVPLPPAGRTIREGQVSPPDSDILSDNPCDRLNSDRYAYQDMKYLAMSAHLFAMDQNETMALTTLRNLKFLVESFITNKEISIVPKRPERPTPDQPKPRI
ncbi:hypothetical protein [Dyadobacter sp. LHD-138]|uniref:hypothetical protein n=1 Tax=Dyadobacter sp. LHD-138 TaxID=3071413 RepID=UPI0027E0E8CB|nr:hypothetical protein [Dyadobacter sp. LHD-138]MDQ6479818.1 hypothetical protein [Dyadobacter sp. LHD-138]